MKEYSEKIPAFGIALFSILSIFVLGVLPFPFVLIYFKLHNNLVEEHANEDCDSVKTIKKQMRLCRTLIILFVLIEIALFVFLFLRFYTNLDELVDMFMNTGCSDCTGK